MTYKPLDINKEELTIMGVPFQNMKSLERAARAIGSNMYEGFTPTPGIIELYRDYVAGKIELVNLPALIREQI
jgi:putative transcriptional regulator